MREELAQEYEEKLRRTLEELEEYKQFTEANFKDNESKKHQSFQRLLVDKDK